MLNATDEGGAAVETFEQPYALTLSYRDSDWQDAGVADEDELNLYYWNGSQWEGILPCSGCSLDTANNKLVVLLDHFSEFGLMGSGAGATDVTISSFGAVRTAPELLKSSGPTACASLGLVTFLVAVVILKGRSSRRPGRS
jgi:hypothetical protein